MAFSFPPPKPDPSWGELFNKKGTRQISITDEIPSRLSELTRRLITSEVSAFSVHNVTEALSGYADFSGRKLGLLHPQ